MNIAIAASPAAAVDTDADIVLVPGRAAYLPATRTLLVADVHLGKAATFRAAGMPVPEGSAQADLARLARLVTETAAARLIVLGDLFHAKRGATEQVFAEFTAARATFAATEVLLVAGNHDRSLGALPPALGVDSLLRTHDEPPFHFVHDPATELPETWRKAECTIGGHLHPTVAITGPGGDRIVERCFVAEGAALVLPAFGSFTGGHRVEPAPGVRLWVARDDGVVDVTRIANLAARPN